MQDKEVLELRLIEMEERFEKRLSVIIENLIEKSLSELVPKCYSKRAACKMIGISFTTLSKRISEGLIKETPGGKISRAEILKYLKSNP